MSSQKSRQCCEHRQKKSKLKRHSPQPSRTDGEAKNPGPDLLKVRKRGPRSLEAQERRKLRNSTNALRAQGRRLLQETGFFNETTSAPADDANHACQNDEEGQETQRDQSFAEAMDARDGRTKKDAEALRDERQVIYPSPSSTQQGVFQVVAHSKRARGMNKEEKEEPRSKKARVQEYVPQKKRTGAWSNNSGDVDDAGAGSRRNYPDEVPTTLFVSLCDFINIVSLFAERNGQMSDTCFSSEIVSMIHELVIACVAV